MSGWRHPGRAGAALYAVAASIVGGLIAVFARLQVARQRGRQRVAQRLPEGGIIVISNHTSYVDGLLLALTARRLGRSLRLLATAGVFKAPIIGPIATRLGFIPVKRGTSEAVDALDGAIAALAHGEAIGLYPEGRITLDPAKWPERSKTGAVRMALRSGAPIVPVAMLGAHKVVGSRRIALRLLVNAIRRPKVDVSVGEPIHVREMMMLDADTDPTADEIRHAADLVMARLIDLVEDLRGEQAPHPFGAPKITA
jgi:1-acyl-sn-glycerol-3-phosphate acyltransferase